MSQSALSIQNEGGAAFRADVNAALQALASVSSGPTAPATTYAYQFWADTTAGVLRQRNAANSAWLLRAPLAETLVVQRSANTALAVGDFSRTIVATGTWTQTFNAAATLGDGWYVEYRNDGTGTITFDPNGAETIDAATTVQLAPGEACSIFCDGTQFKTSGRTSPGLQAQTATAFTSAGPAPAFALTPVPAAPAYGAGQRFRVKFHAAGTTGSNSLNVSGLGARNLMQYDATGAKTSGVVASGQLADVEFDGTDMVILDPLPPPAAATSKLNKQVFTSSGTFTFPAGTTASTLFKVTLVGAGGGTGSGAGNGGNTTISSGTQTITTVTAGGGTGNVSAASGAAGGTATNGDLNIPGGAGGDSAGSGSSDAWPAAATGGSSLFGAGGELNRSSTVGNPGQLYGGGASGIQGAGTGGRGGAGAGATAIKWLSGMTAGATINVTIGAAGAGATAGAQGLAFIEWVL